MGHTVALCRALLPLGNFLAPVDQYFSSGNFCTYQLDHATPRIHPSIMATSRLITRSVAATMTGPLERMVGSLDCRGKGTNHPLPQVDPVVLCELAVVTGKNLPPFGMHPHHGVIAVTTVFEDRDNINGESGQHQLAGGVYAVSAGKGVCHEEKTHTDGRHRAIQTVFKIPDEKLDLPPVLVKVAAEDIPIVKLDGGEARVMLGRLGKVESPAKLQSLPMVVILRICIEAGKRMKLPLDEHFEHGLVFVISGGCKLGEEGVAAAEGGGCFLFGDGGELIIETHTEEQAEIFLVAAKPLREPWVKMLGRSGFIVTKNEQEAEKVMEVINKFGDEFTFQKF